MATQPAPWTAVDMAFLTNDELKALADISRRLHPNREGAAGPLEPDRRDTSEDVSTLPGSSRSGAA